MTLRHFMVTQLISAGVDVRTVSGRAGHRDGNALVCSCGCGRRIRVARSVLELAPILCAGCGQPFDPEDAG